MTRHARPGVTFPHLLTLLLLTALIPTVALAYVPPLGSSPTTEIVSSRTFRILDENGQSRTVPDLAKSGQVLVQLWPYSSPAQVTAMLQAKGCRVIHEYHTPGLLLVGLPAGMSANEGANMLRRESGLVRSAGPDRFAYMDRVPNDPYYSRQYQWPIIAAPTAWDAQTGSSSVVVGVVDSGVDLAHEDLQGQFWRNPGEIAGNGLDDDLNGYVDDVNGWDFINGNNDPRPGDGSHGTSSDHGTHVSGLIGAVTDNGVGVAGHSWHCQIMPVQVFNEGGSLTSIIIAAYEYARDNGANVINMSLGGGWTDLWTDPITEAYNNGIVTVCSAGDQSFYDDFRYFYTDDPSTWRSPVCNDGASFSDNHIIGVGATDDHDVCAWFTCLDQSARSFVDVMAPGDIIYSTVYYNPADGFFNQYDYMSGTSMAAPITAGLAALVRAHAPTLTVMGVMQQIVAGCDNIDAANPINVGYMGAGRINSANSLADKAPGAPRSVMAFDTPNDTGGSITVTWSLSLDDGRGFNDVVRYEVWRSTDGAGPFTYLDSVPKGGKGYVDAVPADYVDYYYIVYACDASGKTASRVTQPAAARDDIAPDAVTVTAADTVADDGGSISLSWSSYAAPQDFLEYHIYRSEKTFDDVTATGITLLKTITNSATKTYQDATTQDNKDYYYAVTCLDSSIPSNQNTKVTAVGPVRSNPNYAFAYPPGLALISVGLTLQSNQLSDVFDLSTGLQFARWNPALDANGAYVLYDAATADPFLRVNPGRGFWMRGTRPVALSLSGAAAENDVRVDFSVGWNQMGNPYVGDVDVTADGTGVRVGGTFYSLTRSNELRYTRDFFWTYDSFTNSYRLVSPNMDLAGTVIRKGEGFFFLADRPGQLILKNPNAPAGAAVAAEPAKKPADEWSLQLSAAVDGAADTDNFLGVSSRSEAITGIISPPPAGDGPDLYFTTGGGRTATDFVESLGRGHTWDLEVACARPGAAVRLTWPDLSALPNDLRPVLTDSVTGRDVYMRTATAYSFTLGPSESSRKFTIEISPKAGDTLVLQSLQTRAAQGNVCISYVLSAPAAVEVEIRNLAGRLVRRLGTGSLSPAGANELLWNCTGEGGQRLPAGNYLVCVTGRAESGQVVKAVQPVQIRR